MKLMQGEIIMNKFKEFTTELVNALENKLEDVTITTQDVIKNNGLKLCGLQIRSECNVAPVIYINDFFEQYKVGKSLDRICEDIKASYLNHQPTHDFDVSKISSFNNVKSEIVYELINYEKNEELLRTVPYIPFLDLAIIFKIVISEFENVVGTILIHNTLLEMWEVGLDELYTYAKENTRKVYGVEFISMSECLSEMLNIDFFEQSEYKLPMYILTNCRRVNGASCLLYDGLLDKISESFQDDLCIIPSSVHECIITPASVINPNELREIVKLINGTELAVDEILSDNIFFYSREKREITM